MIRKNLLQLLFSGAYLWRWNDKLRPVELAEIDKQGHKMLVAWALVQLYGAKLEPSDFRSLEARIIEGALFDYFYRSVITDIKPPVFYKIKENREHYAKLTQYVLERLAPALEPLGPFWERMQKWHLEAENIEAPERRLLNAAHLFASQWEFNLIRPLNHFDDEMEGIGEYFKSSLSQHADLPGVKEILTPGHALMRFANLCGQLRFQIRWAQAPRIPPTSVLGHMFIMASCAYFFSLSIKSSQSRANNNFFAGLFHDFPELLTRDIISPVKRSIKGLPDLLRDYEKSELNRRVLLPLQNAGLFGLVERISFYLGLEAGSEFLECIRMPNGEIRTMADFSELQKADAPGADAKDGQLLKTCDLLGAFLEAHNSIQNGVSSPQLVEARARLKAQISKNSPQCLKLESLLIDFD